MHRHFCHLPCKLSYHHRMERKKKPVRHFAIVHTYNPPLYCTLCLLIPYRRLSPSHSLLNQSTTCTCLCPYFIESNIFFFLFCIFIYRNSSSGEKPNFTAMPTRFHLSYLLFSLSLSHFEVFFFSKKNSWTILISCRSLIRFIFMK